jgi:ribonuclease BN (tRNA processing enzyme)
VRRLAAAQKKGIPGIGPNKVHTVFITHLHSDHTLGYPDIMLSPAVTGRKGGLEVYGPTGLNDMTKDILAAWSKDIDIRLHGMEDGHAAAYVIHSHEIGPGVVYKDKNVTVTAFLVKHGSWDEALGYRFNTADRTIVFSGDTRPTEAIAQQCHGCDVLIHEVYPEAGYAKQPAADKPYYRAFHTSTVELAAIAKDAQPKLLVLNHVLFWGTTPDDVVKEMEAAGYHGKIVVANDLDVF